MSRLLLLWWMDGTSVQLHSRVPVLLAKRRKVFFSYVLGLLDPPMEDMVDGVRVGTLRRRRTVNFPPNLVLITLGNNFVVGND